MSMLLSRHITERIPEDRQKLIPNVYSQVANPVIEYTDLPKEIAVMGLSLDKKFLTVGGRREHRVL